MIDAVNTCRRFPDPTVILLDGFHRWTELVLAYPDLLKQCKFIFVPGIHDPGPGNLLPRPRLHHSVTSQVSTRIKNVVFTSNPCRIRYGTQQIVIFREDILSRMRRNTLIKPISSEIDDDRLHVRLSLSPHT
jgi:DNA polymerase epsilon subunit 2